MNGAFYDATNVFWKLRYGKVYESILSTPVGPKDVAAGETMWAVVRAMLYSAAYLVVIVALGLVDSWWALLALPACFVIGFGVRRRGDRRGDLDAELAGLRARAARHAPDVPVLGDLLPDLRLSRRRSSGSCGACRCTTGSSSSAR